MNKHYTIRPHHILCLQGFQGKGYSDAFTSNMARVISELNQNPDSLVTLTCAQDDFCSSCPHHTPTACIKDHESDKRMRTRDRAVLEHLGVPDQTTKTYAQWLGLTARSYHTQMDALRSCSGCEWQGICGWYQGLERQNNRIGIFKSHDFKITSDFDEWPDDIAESLGLKSNS